MKVIQWMKKNLSGTILVLANLVTVFQVIYFDLNILPILILYWIEVLIIGTLNIPKIYFYYERKKLDYMFMFILPHIIFSSVLLVFIVGLFIEGSTYQQQQEGVVDIVLVVVFYLPSLWVPACALAISHLFSLFYNYIGKKEYLIKSSRNDPMFMPIYRIFMVLIVLAIGGGYAITFGQKFNSIVIIVFVKIFVDLVIHLRQHRTVDRFFS